MKLIPDFNPPEFSRLTFHNAAGREFWAPKIREAASSAHKNELVTVSLGMRQCATLHIPNWNASQYYRQLTDLGLLWKHLRAVGSGPGGFSHKAHPVPEDTVKFNWYTVVARTDEDLEAFAKAHEVNDHDTIGKMLGFPDCCREWFTKVWPTYRDPIWQQAENSPQEAPQWPVGPMATTLQVQGHPYCNSAMRYIGIRSMFHLPCSFNCEASIALGDQWFDIMRKHSPNAARWAGWMLSLPQRWDVLHGHAKTVTPAFTIHAGSVEAAERYVVIMKGYDAMLPPGDIPGAIGGIWYPMMTNLKQIPLEVVK